MLTQNPTVKPSHTPGSKIHLCKHNRGTAKMSRLGTISVNVQRVIGYDSLKHHYYRSETTFNRVAR